MCGIAGMFGEGASREKVQRMVDALRRRGPDDAGVWMDDKGQVALGHARLSIIDLSAAGHQPMTSSDGNRTIVFNGEIYNYQELRKELEMGGATFQSHSDTEIILWGWKIWGHDTPSRLRGMFAFAIWNQLDRSLTLVRDRMGIKPLLWFQNTHGLLFGSTLKALLESEDVPPVLNEQGFFDYLCYGAVCQPQTMIQGVNALPPGVMMTIDQKGKIQTEKYWSLERNIQMTHELALLPYNEQVERTRSLLEESSRYHLVSDVPVGSFLSGGVDSTVITALMARQSRYPIKSFSIGFVNGTDLCNELTEARSAAEYIGCDHTEIILSGTEVVDALDDFVVSLDQPSVDGLNTYWVSKIAKQYVKVALSGLGGDELFAGYGFFGRFSPGYLAEKSSWMDHVQAFAYRLWPHRWTEERFYRTAPPRDKLSIIRRMCTDSSIRKIVSPRLKQLFVSNHAQRYIAGLDIYDDDQIAQTTRYECRHYLLNTLLRDTDALSMAHGVEVRPMLLDHNLVELALALPATSKWREGIGKAVLKDASKDLLPVGFFERKKTGFVLPVGRWLDNELHERFMYVLQERMANQYFDKRFLKHLIHMGSKWYGHKVAWSVFVFLMWCRANKIQVA
jgi:asparagine synthase (glutamine-hydrolyzing)